MQHVYYVSSLGDGLRTHTDFVSININTLNAILTNHPGARVTNITPCFKGEGRHCTEAFIIIEFTENDCCDPLKLTLGK